MDRLRIGILGTARIAGNALITPARQVEEAVVTAVAARDPDRARSFAAANGIPETRESYGALIADPDIDAIYNPLPNALHRPWTLRALQAGKHVLCEKPLTCNADEAQEVAAAAQAAGRVVMEGFHYRYHPLAQRMREIVTGDGGDAGTGELGQVRDIEVTLRFPTADPADIRFSYELGGGANMDGGCYAIHLLRFLGPGEPVVRSAQAQESAPGVDIVMTAELGFPSGATGRFVVSLLSGETFTADVNVTGTDGELRVANFMVPQNGYEMEVTSHGQTRQEQVTGEPTYTCQLRAFAAAVLRGGPVPTSAAGAVANMRLIDEVYRAAGLPPRGT